MTERLVACALVVCLVSGGAAVAQTSDDLVFIHHSCGRNWMESGLHSALLAKDYIDERNDIYYNTDFPPDTGRPDSLAPEPGDSTNMNHWVRWFNDYLGGAQSRGCADGFNKIIMFKSCYPASNISSEGSGGDPFSSTLTIANYKSVYRHPSGAGNTYSNSGYTYEPLEDVFAANPDTLFVPVTAPPLHNTATNDANGARARQFNNWLKGEWLTGYNGSNPGLNNVAVFDWFGVLANPNDAATYPNRLRADYGGASGNSHPNAAGNAASTLVFATNPSNFIDDAWELFMGGPRIDGDMNGDGFVGGLDLNIVLSAWGDFVTPNDWLAGDWSGDGFVGGTDLNAVLTHWGQSDEPDNPVPEPTTTAILAFGAMAAMRRKRG